MGPAAARVLAALRVTPLRTSFQRLCAIGTDQTSRTQMVRLAMFPYDQTRIRSGASR
jgi:hypothetical protein